MTTGSSDDREGQLRNTGQDVPDTPRVQDWPPRDDEISLFDLWDALVRRRWLIVSVTGLVTAAALAYALVKPEVYRYRQVLEIGSRLTGEEVRLIEQPSSVAAKLNQNYIPATIQSWVAEQGKATWEPEASASVPQDANIVVLEAEGTEKRSETLSQILASASSELVAAHDRIITTIRQELRADITEARNKVQATKSERERLRSELARLDERKKLLEQEIADLETLLAEAEASRKQATESLTGAPQAMTLMMLNNEARQARQRLAELRTRLRVKLPNERNALQGKIEDKAREVEAQRADLKVAKTRLENLSSTRPLGPPQQSLETVGTSGRLILALGIVLGGMLGVFAAFFAEFLAAARRRREEGGSTG